MRRSIVVPVVASIVAIVVAALVSVGLSYAQAMMENVGSMRSLMHRIDENDQTDCDEGMPTHMNATQHMPENMHDACNDMRDHMNMTSHMEHMH